MEAPKVPETPPALSIAPVRFEIVLADDVDNPLAFVSPPIKDITEMAELANDCFSLAQATRDASPFEASARHRLQNLKSKSGAFSDSPTLFNRIANLQRVIGDLDAESESLANASRLNGTTFFRRKIAENLLRSGHSDAAKRAFIDLSASDSYSSLRVASFLVKTGNLGEAEAWVMKAIEQEPEGYAERLFQGGLLLVRGEFQKAIRILWMALDERPTSCVAYTNLAIAYLGTSNAKKAFTALKRAVAIDPFNRSAILALADVAHLVRRDFDAINSIRYFLQFEQREPAIWSRLARALLSIEAYDECIAALKRQGALERTVPLWNNLGVAYSRAKRTKQSLEAFNYALKIEGSGGSREELIVARNIAQIISTTGKPALLLGVTESIVGGDRNRALSHDHQLCDIYGFHISALMQMNRKAEALDLAETLLADPALGEPLAQWIVQSLAGIYGLSRTADTKLLAIIDKYLGANPSKNGVGLMNNIAFALAELGHLDEAERCIFQVANALHRDPYLTATLGLLNFRRGRARRGEELYKEAISLAQKSHDKNRIRQKMYLEIGRQLASSDAKEARRAFEKVRSETKGERALVRQADHYLKALSEK